MATGWIISVIADLLGVSGPGRGPRCESRATLTRPRPGSQVLYAADRTCRVALRHMRRLAPLALASSLAALALVVPGIASATSVPGAPGKVVLTSGRANSDAPAPAAND